MKTIKTLSDIVVEIHPSRQLKYKMFKLFQNVFRLFGKLSITSATLFTPTVVLFEDLGPMC